MIAINKNRIEKSEELKYAEINAATYITCCLSDKEIEKLKEKWNENGGFKAIPWYKWVLQHTSITVSLD